MTYGTLAVGLGLVYRSSQVINFAHGLAQFLLRFSSLVNAQARAAATFPQPNTIGYRSRVTHAALHPFCGSGPNPAATMPAAS